MMNPPKGSTESINSTDPNHNTLTSDLKDVSKVISSESSLTVPGTQVSYGTLPNGPPPEKPGKKSILKSAPSHESLSDDGLKVASSETGSQTSDAKLTYKSETKPDVHVVMKLDESDNIISIIPNTDPYHEKVAPKEMAPKENADPYDKLRGRRVSIDEHGHSSTPSSGGRRQSFAKRASISIDIMRRKSVEQIKHTFSHYKGIVLAMVSSVFFTITTVIVKHLRDVHPGEMACFRFLGILLFTIPMIITAGVNPFGPKEKRHFLILRGIAGASSLYLRYSALHYLPIANATVVVLSMPVFVCIFARIFLKEPCGVFHVVALAVTLVGIGFTTKVSALIGLTDDAGVDKYKEILGLAYSMGATLIGSSVYIFVRKVKECHNSVILFNFAIVAIVETSILTAVDDGFTLPHVGYAPWLLVILAILSFYAQLLLTTALQLEEASLVSVTRASMEVVCAFIFQIIIFRHIPDMYAFIGAFLVTSSVLLTAARKWVVVLPPGHIGRKLLGFTLK